MTLTPGSCLGHFEIVGPLGSGGMGEVYRAKDKRLGRDVAIKVITGTLGQTAETLDRFEREAKFVAALSHPGIVSIYEFDRDEQTGVVFIATELLDGETLRERLGRGALSWRRAAEIAAAIAEALAAAHQSGFVHRDLKPENVFLTRDARVKVLDFGLARDLRVLRDAQSMEPTQRKMTDPGVILGTVSYMSPEQARGEAADPRSDIFSLGCMMFEMLTASRAFRASTAAETLSAILRDDPPRHELTAKDVPAELIAIVDHCLEKSREDRFQSARDLAFDLKAIVSGSFGTRRTSGNHSGHSKSIAVLPFLNAAGDADAEYLSDGITESIITRLSRLQNLRVMAHSTVSRYKQRGDAREIGEMMGVQSVLTGRLLQRGDTLVIRTELVSVSDGTQLWGERYNRKAADLLDIEEEIAKEISDHLRIQLTGEDERRLTRRQTESSEAYHAYLKGRFHWSNRSEAGIKRGIAHFNEALEADPEYALAWVGVADSYNISGFYSFLAPSEAFPKAEAAAQKALRIDPALAQAHASLGYSTHYFRWDWCRAEEMFRRALELTPDAFTHHFYANHLVGCGRFEEAARHFRDALELEPLSQVINAGVGWADFFWRRYDRAIDQLRKTLALSDNFSLAHVWLSWALTATSTFEPAVIEAERAVALGWTNDAVGSYAHACAAGGNVTRARDVLNDLISRSRGRYVHSYYPALVFTALGDERAAIEWLKRAESERSPFLTLLRVDPRWDRLRDNPEFGAIVERVGL